MKFMRLPITNSRTCPLSLGRDRVAILTKRVKVLEKTASVDLTRCENQCLSVSSIT